MDQSVEAEEQQEQLLAMGLAVKVEQDIMVLVQLVHLE
jgi:hypothetical protein